MPTPAETTPSTETRRTPRPGRWRRRLVRTGLTLLLLVLLAPLALRLGAVRGWLAGRVGQALDRRVEIGSASGYWFRGIDLEDVVVHSPEGYDGPLAQVAKIHADVDLLATLGGTPTARLRVVQPYVTLRRDVEGRSNARDLGGAREEPGRPARPEAAPEEPRRLDLRIVLLGGSVEALDAAGHAENALHDIQLGASVLPDGRGTLELNADAVGAGADGKDVHVAAVWSSDSDGTGLFDVDVPPLRLERLARLAQDAVQVGELTGTVRVKGNGTLHPDQTLSGELEAELLEVGGRGPDGTRLWSRRVTASARLRAVNRETEAVVDVRMGDVRLERTGAEAFREPEVTVQATARWNPAEKRLRVDPGRVEGGSLLQVTVREPLRLEAGEAAGFQGRLEAHVDLGRLAALRGIVPALEPLAGGRLHLDVSGGGGEELDLGIGLAIDDLALRPGDSLPDGYAEPRVIAALRVQRPAGQGTRLVLGQLESLLATLQPAADRRPPVLTLAPDGGYALDGDFDLRLRLDAAGRLLAARLGLKSGERLEGTLRLAGTGRGTPEDMRVEAQLEGRSIRVPPSWSPVQTTASLAGQIVTTRTRDEAQLSVSQLAGMGLSGKADVRWRARPAPAGDSAWALRSAEADLGVDLAAARPWLGGLLGMDPQGELAGRARVDLRVEPEAGGHHLVGTAQANDLVLRLRPQAAPVREARVNVHGDLHLAEAGGRHEARELKVDTAAVKLDLGGSTYVDAPDADADVRAVLSGDAARLAPVLSAILGEGYEDLTGSGKLAGSVTLHGSPADHGAALFTEIDLALGSWSTAGLRAENVLLRGERRDAAAPLALQLDAKLNGGAAGATARARLGEEQVPWEATLRLAGVDTSTLLTSRGAGRALAFALPALLPADAQVQVLSGRLDANLAAQAPATGGAAMTDGLTGSGTLRMERGEIKQSTLFGGGSDDKLAKLIAALRVGVPEAGAVLSELSKAVAFETLESSFEIGARTVTVTRTNLTGQRVVVDLAGTVGFDERLALEGKVTLQGTPGEKLAKVAPGGAIPLAVGGTLSRPAVQPKLDPAALVAGGDKDGLLDKIKKKLPDLPDLPKVPKPKLPKLPNPFK